MKIGAPPQGTGIEEADRKPIQKLLEDIIASEEQQRLQREAEAVQIKRNVYELLFGKPVTAINFDEQGCIENIEINNVTLKPTSYDDNSYDEETGKKCERGRGHWLWIEEGEDSDG